MAKICPETNEKVLYLDCLDCENKGKCGKVEVKDKVDGRKEDESPDSN